MARPMKTMDGNNAASHVSYAYTDVAAIYPITPSSVMAEVADEWATQGRKNIFGQTVQMTEMQSEAGAAGTVHGSLAAGAMTTTFTASQGLLLMIPNLYKVAGEQLPGVFNVSARAVASHALSIFGDHSDVYACRQTGCAMLCEGSVQEVMDLTPVAHCAAVKGKVPFINFFDGFRTSHELQKIEVWEYDDLKDLIDLDEVEKFRNRGLNPNHPVSRGSAQNPDIFFQVREACNPYYDALPDVVTECMNKVNAKLGTDYKLFNYVGAPDAERIIVAMGSVCETIEETIDYLASKGEKVGLIKVRLYRPFKAEALIDVIPDTVKIISVLDRTKEPGSLGEPLYMDVFTALRDDEKFNHVKIFSGRYGLSSKDTTPAHIVSIYKNDSKKKFTVGIVDDVTNLSLEVGAPIQTTPEGTTNCKFWGLGADGTVGANKNSIKIIGDNTDMYAQAYFDYDSKKSGGVTMSHLRFGKKPIQSTYLIKTADFVACHCPAYVKLYNMVQELRDGGTFLLNCEWTEEELDEALPGQMKRYIAEHNIKFYIIDGIALGKKIGLGGRINTILQSAFFKLTGIIPEKEAIEYMKAAAKKTYGRKGDDVINMNYAAIDAGAGEAKEVKVPDSWKNCTDEDFHKKAVGDNADAVEFVNKVQRAVAAQEGNTLPVSTFVKYVDGTTPAGTAAFEKRGVAVDAPVWVTENCIQCGRCAYVCPHATIRTVALTEDEAKAAPAELKTIPLTGMADLKFSIVVSQLDCLGCGSCANVCPGKKGEKALVMESMREHINEQVAFDYVVKLPEKQEVIDKFKIDTVKGSQFKQPLLEFSGACAGCGETPYARLITQLFGDRMYIANATGCSSIWGNSSPSTPYTTNRFGRGPAWDNSLFEDNAEFGLGMALANKAIRKRLNEELQKAVAEDASLKEAYDKWVETYESSAANLPATTDLIAALEKSSSAKAKEILAEKDFLNKKSHWIFGGDGWAYDIGFGGLDHVIASGEDVNIMVFDTEVYSNTGGQSSKATPTGAIAQFAAAGKAIRKKDLAGIAMSYGYVYVAHIAMGADYNQCVKAISEAEAYNGPSIIIAYAPCINHGIKKGMSKAQTEEELAVKSGYWHCFRYDPRKVEEGKNPFTLDSKAPTESYQEFIQGEVRYNSLERQDPERAKELFARSEIEAKRRYEELLAKAGK